VIVVGDACTDDSESIVRSFGDPRVRWDNLSENSGNHALPNQRGIELARGEYVAYLSHDDLWLRRTSRTSCGPCCVLEPGGRSQQFRRSGRRAATSG